MIFVLVAQVFSLLLDSIWLDQQGSHDTDLEILLRQLRILQRKQPQRTGERRRQF